MSDIKEIKYEEVTLPQAFAPVAMLLYVTVQLKAKLVDGWKVGGVEHSNSLTKKVVLFR